ncbi:hypothetical protein DFH07DRAFT_853726 [Mycena maculata]|uniref:SWIM-type domain-containing protein n=1 Tax=Mycena maculata TaxID=230809 RepID=A0AAD7HQB1_9AGAR|nr:hypothetical protein DFH07DRAFT_853726 [Mycena maculata]
MLLSSSTKSALSCYADAVIASVGPESLTSEHTFLNLQAVFPRNLVIAALDLIDHENVLTCKGLALGQYQVLGSTSTYHVFLDIPGPTSTYCTCPAFAYLVLSSETYLMCKHVLAARLAHRMGRCIERPVDTDQLSQMITQEYNY